MKQAVISGMKEVVVRRLFFGTTLLLVIIILSQSEAILTVFPVTALLPYCFHIDLLVNAINSDMVISFVPIIATLPFACAYVDEIKSNYVRYLCIRSKYSEYIISRIVVCWIAGIVIIALGIVAAWGIATFVFTPLEATSDTPSDRAELLNQKSVLMMLSGGMWSVVGMSMSALMESKYISYATPFVLYYLLVILYERYFSDLFIIYPKTWTDPTAWPFGCWGAAIFLLEITLIFAILFAFRAGRRLQQL